VTIAIARETKKSGRTLACGQGCTVCCRVQTDIPAYPIELVGMSWYVIEKLTPPLRSIVKSHLVTRRKDGSCPFLVDGACVVYSVRPMACRQFNVFTRPCGENEDAFHTRRHDVLTPIESFTEEALSRTLPFYGISPNEAKKRGIPVRMLNARVRVLREYPWEELAIRMDDFDFRQLGKLRTE
jgi:Fe-S-cluster containining protein